MKNLIKIFAIIWLGITLSIILQSESRAQGKKDPTVTEIQTASPVFYYVYEVKDDNGEITGTVELQIHDRLHQFVSFGFDRVNDQARQLDPKNPLIKLIQMPEVHLLAFRQAESIDEALLPVDNKTVLEVRYNDLKAAARILYK